MFNATILFGALIWDLDIHSHKLYQNTVGLVYILATMVSIGLLPLECTQRSDLSSRNDALPGESPLSVLYTIYSNNTRVRRLYPQLVIFAISPIYIYSPTCYNLAGHSFEVILKNKTPQTKDLLLMSWEGRGGGG